MALQRRILPHFSLACLIKPKIQSYDTNEIFKIFYSRNNPFFQIFFQRAIIVIYKENHLAKLEALIFTSKRNDWSKNSWIMERKRISLFRRIFTVAFDRLC